MTYFLKNGTSFRVTTKDAMDLHEKLPAGNYIIKEDPFGNLYLEHIESFKNPTKLYGDTLKNTDRIIRTFKDRAVSTGVMLTGEKGSGKTLLAKNISLELAKQDIPTIVINTPWHGDKFNKFLQDIEQPCMVLFDEFEKVYDRDQQEEILTLLDGVFGSKKLYALTCNDKWRVDIHMRNRPGRIYYMIDFKGLGAEFITEYCHDNLKVEMHKHIEKMCSIASLFAEFNFDMLKAMVEEMNRYDESPQEVLRILNAKPEFDGGTKYEVQIVVNGQEAKDFSPSIFDGNPLQPRGIEIGYDLDPENDDIPWQNKQFNPDTLVSLDAKVGKFVFEDKGTKLVLTRQKEKYFNFDAF